MLPVAMPVSPFPRVAPLSPGRFALQVTIDRRTHDLLKRAQELLAHAQPGCDVSQVLERALLELVQRLESRKHGATDTPRVRRASLDTRYIPAEIKRQVSERDRHRCTFVSTQGRRCEERSMLEYGHALPVARGGRSTVENLRLRCRAHNQYEAECAYGAGFMHAKRPVEGADRPTGFEPDAGLRSPQAGPSAAALHDAPTVEGFRPAVL
jgi:5-methylcytosine-specific restriction endonuclease McrA